MAGKGLSGGYLYSQYIREAELVDKLELVTRRGDAIRDILNCYRFRQDTLNLRGISSAFIFKFKLWIFYFDFILSDYI